MYACPLYNSTTKIIEYIFAVIFLLNTLFHVGRYTWISLTLKPVSLSPQQKALLHIKDSGKILEFILTHI